jgi:3-methyladenine DNA glycosylase/8-oxoguanine DNA glycosylase
MVQGEIRARLARDKRVYKAAINGADTLQSSGVAQVNIELGTEFTRLTMDALTRFDLEKTVSGPIAQTIQIAAKAISNGLSKEKAVDTAYRAIVDQLSA